MPQNPKLINKAFKKVLKENPELTADSIRQIVKQERKTDLISLMKVEVNILKRKKQITAQQRKYALEALEFYDQNVSILPFQKNAVSTLNELIAIDYSKPVKIVKIKEGRVMTQMQHPHSLDKVGGFYAKGSLPKDFHKRADFSGIGLKSRGNGETEKKSVYQSKSNKTCVFLRTTASKAKDTWSIPSQVQSTRGGGVQWRVATGDYDGMTRLKYGELNKGKEGSRNKSLLKGVGVVPISRLKKMVSNFTSEVGSLFKLKKPRGVRRCRKNSTKRKR
jgi:hypothetical protein